MIQWCITSFAVWHITFSSCQVPKEKKWVWLFSKTKAFFVFCLDSAIKLAIQREKNTKKTARNTSCSKFSFQLVTRTQQLFCLSSRSLVSLSLPFFLVAIYCAREKRIIPPWIARSERKGERETDRQVCCYDTFITLTLFYCNESNAPARNILLLCRDKSLLSRFVYWRTRFWGQYLFLHSFGRRCYRIALVSAISSCQEENGRALLRKSYYMFKCRSVQKYIDCACFG